MSKFCITILIFFLTGVLIPVSFAFASTTSGTIDSSDKYAYGENIGWLDFGTTAGNVAVTDSAISGYAWSENIGWISLNCSNDSSCTTVNYSVANDGAGTLSGYAWSENAGWINFAPTGGGVTINSSGEFLGYAYGENVGWITFNCATTSSCGTVDYKVKTDYRPRSARAACNNSTDDDGDGLTDYPNDPGCSSLTDTDETDPVSPGGSSLPTGAYNPPAPPSAQAGGGEKNEPAGFIIIINSGDEYTNSRTVSLVLNGGADAVKMAVSNAADFKYAGQEPYQTSKNWTLTEREGAKTVYVKFYTKYGVASETVPDSIIYSLSWGLEQEENAAEAAKLPPPEIEPPTEKPKQPLIEKIPKILKSLVPDFLKPQPPEIKPPEIPLEEQLAKEAPVALRGEWNLLASEPINEFVLAPLPREIRNLAEKFPKLATAFSELGIAKSSDLDKLEAIKMTLSGLNEIKQVNGQMPTEIVFANGGGEKIDLNIILTVDSQGRPLQKITAVSGQSLHLALKPAEPVKSVKGYLAFKSKQSQPTSLELSLPNLLSSLVFARPALAKSQERSVEVSEELILLEFEYTDLDGDGIYTADIDLPKVEGEYEIITVMDYVSLDLGKKEIRLITVVDPEGYIYKKDYQGRETRIPSAAVAIYQLNLGTRQFELWPAEQYQQENPQITDNTGKYSFLTPEGNYYLKVEAPGFQTYQSNFFEVKAGRGVHENIELKQKWGLNLNRCMS